MIVAILGVFTAQTLTVLLSIAFMLLSTAVLVLVLDSIARRDAEANERLVLQPVRTTGGRSGPTVRSSIAQGAAAPSRAPPTFFLRQRCIDRSGPGSRE